VLSAFDFRQDVTTIAGQVQNRMDEAFEGTQLENVDNLEGVDQQVLSDIRVAMFRNAVSVEMGRLRGIPADQFENEVEKLSPGFTY
ncbi:MAG TPA: hypothetical protein VFV28_03935, partial [Limnobacter sp.]|nr:hypothetical protein [Limnobacter sp.]